MNAKPRYRVRVRQKFVTADGVALTRYAAPNVIALPMVTKQNIDPERILQNALKRELESCMVLGWTEDGEFYFASSAADGGEILWWMELARYRLMQVNDPLDAGD